MRTFQICLLMLTEILSRKIKSCTCFSLLRCQVSIWNVDLQNVWKLPLWRTEENVSSNPYIRWCVHMLWSQKGNKGFLQTCLKTRLRLHHHWVITTLTLFTNRNQIYCCIDQKNAGYHERTWNRFHFHWGWSSYIQESTWCDVCIEK